MNASSDAPKPHPPGAPPKEQELVLRPGPIVRALVITLGVCLLAAAGIAQLTANPGQNALAIIAGVVLCGGFFLGGTFIVASGKPRPATTLAALALGMLLVRVMGLGVAAISIYFAAPHALVPAVAGAGGAYLACLAVETVCIARQASVS